MGKVLVTRIIPKVGVEALKAAGHRVSVWSQDRVIPRKELLRRVKGCDAVLSMLTERIDEDLILAAGPQLKIVANFAVGFDNLDAAALRKHGILATNTPSVLNGAVAEHAFALMLAIAKRIPESDRFTRAGKYRGWKPLLLLGAELSGKTLGVIGLGRIGASLARRAFRGMDMKIMYHDVARNENFERECNATFATAEEILRQADFVSLHVPLLPTTRHLIDAARLKLMKRSAYLINTSRGPIIDEKALVAALKAGRIAGAALDVYEHEPKLAAGLARLPNVVLTPHIASATHETRDAMALLAAQAINEALRGTTPKNLIPA